MLAGLSAVHPFIELPDLVVNDPKALNANVITAIDVGARKGVLGAAILGHPLNAVLWLSSSSDSDQ